MPASPDSTERTTPGTTTTTSITTATTTLAIVDAATAWLSPDVIAWGATSGTVQRWLEPELERLDNANFGTQVCDAVVLPVSDPLLWANRVIGLPDGQWALAGVRFRDRDLDRCFVDVIATSLPPRPESLAALTPVLEFFADFAPKRLRVTVPDPDLFAASDDPAAPDTEVDLRVVATPLDGSASSTVSSTSSPEALPEAPSTEGVTLVDATPQDAAARAERIYGRIAADKPVLLEWSHPSTADYLTDPAEEGLLFTVRLHDEDAGVLALRRQDDYGLAGWLVEEKCVDPAFQGHNLSAAASALAMERLAAHPDSAAIRDAGSRPVLWGHIHKDNVPSLRSAFAVGRRTVGGYLWVTPEGYPGF